MSRLQLPFNCHDSACVARCKICYVHPPILIGWLPSQSPRAGWSSGRARDRFPCLGRSLSPPDRRHGPPVSALLVLLVPSCETSLDLLDADVGVALMEFAYNTPEAAELRAFDTDLFPEYRLSEVMLGYSANCLVGLGAIPASRTLC